MAYLSGCRQKGKHPFRSTGGGVLLQQIPQQESYIATQHRCSIFAAEPICPGAVRPSDESRIIFIYQHVN
jgi:hypothetical protein